MIEGEKNTFLTHFLSTNLVSSASLGICRILYGGVLCYSLLRLIFSGWIEILWVQPTFFFKYAWATWMPVWSPTGLYIHVLITLIAAFMVMVGLFFRASLVAFVLGFTSLQLMDQSNYLNHYYLVLCLSIPLGLSSAGQRFSLDVLWRKLERQSLVPLWQVNLFRFQIGIVYVFAAIAKLGTDWLLHAQPLSIWLSSRGDLPIIGSLLTQVWVAFMMSWAGFLYDLLIVPALLYRPFRKYAYFIVICFHSMTLILFDIGIFPLLMTTMTLIFFSPSWPENLKSTFFDKDKKAHKATSVQEYESEGNQNSPSPMLTVFCSMWISFHLLFPLRGYYLDENIQWSERGMRYSWRVMVREKMGSVTYRVKSKYSMREWEVNPSEYLEPRQLSEMSGQPDMIVQLAHWVKYNFESRLGSPVEVYADAWVSLNGRSPQRIINPKLNLIEVSLDHPQLILSPPLEAPLKAR